MFHPATTNLDFHFVEMMSHSSKILHLEENSVDKYLRNPSLARWYCQNIVKNNFTEMAFSNEGWTDLE
jgi:hypothetical protein